MLELGAEIEQQLCLVYTSFLLDLLVTLNLQREADCAVLPREILVNSLCPQELDSSDPLITLVFRVRRKIEVTLVLLFVRLTREPRGSRDGETVGIARFHLCRDHCIDELQWDGAKEFSSVVLVPVVVPAEPLGGNNDQSELSTCINTRPLLLNISFEGDVLRIRGNTIGDSSNDEACTSLLI